MCRIENPKMLLWRWVTELLSCKARWSAETNVQNKPGQHFRKVSAEDRFVQLRIIDKNIMSQPAIPYILFGGIEKLQPLLCRRKKYRTFSV